MEKSITDGLIELSITNLIQCLEENNKKESFINSISQEEYSKIVSLMREESTIIQMRDFHNWIKSNLITNIKEYYSFTKRDSKVALLDISVGRGGDLMKWKNAHITDVFGFDVNKESIYSKNPENPGAVERLANLKNYNTNVEFAIGDATMPLGNSKLSIPNIDNTLTNYLIKNKIKQFDLVSCQFALHYYFSSEEALRNVLSLVSKYLKPGGYFFGTTIDGQKIKEYLEASTSGKEFKRKLYQIKVSKKFPKKFKSPFGNKYSFTIYDNKDKTNYFNTIPESIEYLTDFEILTLIANQYSLEPVFINFFESYTSNGKKKYTNHPSNIIQFEDIYRLGKWTPKDKTKQITPEQLELSFLNSTFVFRKK
jgi:mRNA (guanine-N7-)-methyltransferase